MAILKSFEEQIEERCGVLRSLETDWDSYGANKLKESTVQMAHDVALHFKSFMQSRELLITLHPAGDGGIEMIMQSDGVCIETYIETYDERISTKE